MLFMKGGGIRCTKHPKYQGIGRPRSQCDRCWRIYFVNHPSAGQS